jgi:hypothetical protein
MMTWGREYWAIFLSVMGLEVLLAFGIPETIALFTERASNHIDNTLSYYARVELHASVATQMNIHSLGWWLSLIVWMMFVSFITPHIWFLQFG